jgi:RecJ-like exonuclease
MYVEEDCSYCQGSGVRTATSSSFLGLLKRTHNEHCQLCRGLGRVLVHARCEHCEGRGLIGNESETCHTCNGTGKLDEFSEIPRASLTPGTEFERHCEGCDGRTFRIAGSVTRQRTAVSWDIIDELRQFETRETVKVQCVSCSRAYDITLHKAAHREFSPEELDRRRQLTRLDRRHTCANLTCEHYCPEGFCMMKDVESVVG